MSRVTALFSALLVAVTCQQQQQTQLQQEQPLQYRVVQNPGPTGPAGFMPMSGGGGGGEEIRRTSEAAAPETSSVQSRDYSGSDFYGYNYPPAASYGVPSSSYGSSPGVSFGDSSAQGEASYSSPGYSSYYPGWGDDTKKRKPGYSTPYYPPTTVSCPTPFTSNILTDLLKTGGTAKFGLVKSVVAAIATLFLAKIPILLAVKALMLKLFVVPLAVVVLSLPVLVPAALLLQPLWKRWKEFVGWDSSSSKPQMVMMMPSSDDSSKPANATQATPAANRALENNLESVLGNLLESERCMERLACQLGVRDAKSDYKQQVSWVLKFLQTLRVVQNNEPIRDKLKQYRDAYNYGTETGLGIVDDENVVNSVCSEMRYPCRSTQKSLQRSTRALVDLAEF